MKRDRQEKIIEYDHVIVRLTTDMLELCNVCIKPLACANCKEYDEYDAKVKDAKKIYGVEE